MVFLPSVVQLVHAFEHHEHAMYMTNDGEQFLENQENCALCHFQLEPQAVVYNFHYTLWDKSQPFVLSEPYNFLSNYQQLPFSLRGPPVFS